MGTKLKRVSDFLASLPGLPIVIAIVLVVLGFLLQLLPADWPVVGWLARTHLFLYLGVILGFIGALLRGAL